MSKRSRMARQGSQSPAGSSNSPAQVRGIGVQKTEIRSAPLPDPEELGRYRDLDPALYELIKTEYAKNGQHRRLIEAEFSATQKALVRGVTRNDMLGIFASWTFAMVFVL
ncbi:MAG TPA: hypothetical protein VG916_04090, partial [Gemmatimonadaceae bacterium]|nr:hypothetical protein [Gemmatimonadaceae bacterium]